MNKPNLNNEFPPMYPWKYITVPNVNINAENAAIKGQGLGSTK